MIQINGHTKVTGLLGSPISPSISPAMHNEAFRQLGIDCIYLAFDADAEKMPSAIEAFRALNVLGFNVTMPGKNIAAKHCDELSPAAKFTGSVNTFETATIKTNSSRNAAIISKAPNNIIPTFLRILITVKKNAFLYILRSLRSNVTCITGT